MFLLVTLLIAALGMSVEPARADAGGPCDSTASDAACAPAEAGPVEIPALDSPSATVISNISATADNGLNANLTYVLASGFTTPASGVYAVNSVTLKIYNQSGVDHVASAWIYSDNAGNPGGSVATFNATTITAAENSWDNQHVFTISAPYILAASTTYWIVVQTDYPGIGGVYWMTSDTTAPSGAFAFVGDRYNQSASGWVPLSNSIAGYFILSLQASKAAYVYSSVGGIPWGQTDNEAAMDAVFGTNGWHSLRYETVDPNVLFSSGLNFIFLEGSQYNADEMEAFLTANQSLIEAWVSNGGRLFLNAAPLEGDGMSFGFGGTNLVYNNPATLSNTGVAVNSSHPIFNGPFTPAGTSYTGSRFSHAYITGGYSIPVMTGDGGVVVLSEQAWGNGVVMFGGLTLPVWQLPQPNSYNLRANILYHLAHMVLVDNISTSIAKEDGYVMEKSETAGIGGAAPSGGKFFKIGDSGGNKQIKGFLSFDTSSLPNDAIILSAHVQMYYVGVSGDSPFIWGGNLKADIASPYFGTSNLLKSEDFSAAASAYDVAFCGTYYCNMHDGFGSINLTGLTQFRLYFTIPDNGDKRPDYLKLASGSFKTVGVRPTLLIQYFVP